MFMEALPLISTTSQLFKLQLEVLSLLNLLQSFPDQERENDKFLPVWLKEHPGMARGAGRLLKPQTPELSLQLLLR